MIGSQQQRIEYNQADFTNIINELKDMEGDNVSKVKYRNALKEL